RHTRWPRDWSSDVCSSDLFCSSVKSTMSASIFMRDETPAATIGGVNGMGWTAPEIGSAVCCRATILLCGPTSFVAAEIHLGRWSAGICDEPIALHHSSCMPEGFDDNILLFQSVPATSSRL